MNNIHLRQFCEREEGREMKKMKTYGSKPSVSSLNSALYDSIDEFVEFSTVIESNWRVDEEVNITETFSVGERLELIILQLQATKNIVLLLFQESTCIFCINNILNFLRWECFWVLLGVFLERWQMASENGLYFLNGLEFWSDSTWMWKVTLLAFYWIQECRLWWMWRPAIDAKLLGLWNCLWGSLCMVFVQLPQILETPYENISFIWNPCQKHLYNVIRRFLNSF